MVERLSVQLELCKCVIADSVVDCEKVNCAIAFRVVPLDVRAASLVRLDVLPILSLSLQPVHRREDRLGHKVRLGTAIHVVHHGICARKVDPLDRLLALLQRREFKRVSHLDNGWWDFAAREFSFFTRRSLLLLLGSSCVF